MKHQTRRRSNKKGRSKPSLSKRGIVRHRNAILRSNREQETRARALQALAHMRREKVSLATASRLEHIKPNTFLRYVGSAVRQDRAGGRYRAPKGDRSRRNLQIPTALGPVTVPIYGSKNAENISKYLNAVAIYLRTGEEAKLRPFKGKTIRVEGKRIKLVTDPNTLSSLAEADALHREAFIWVFTSLEDVGYVYSETREAATPKRVLADFRGVLVTDFYSAYESIDCRQQKCLIHLIRDLNDDLRRNPFNEEIQEFGKSFAALLRPMIETLDRYGLKGRYLRRYLKSVDRFYKLLAEHDYQSEVAVKYRKRFDKNRTSLFTFLEYDGIPWNNNNAEHAIKALADLRNVIGGTSSPKGIQEYLVLLSICQTCKYRGINFFEFVHSGELEIERFRFANEVMSPEQSK